MLTPLCCLRSPPLARARRAQAPHRRRRPRPGNRARAVRSRQRAPRRRPTRQRRADRRIQHAGAAAAGAAAAPQLGAAGCARARSLGRQRRRPPPVPRCSPRLTTGGGSRGLRRARCRCLRWAQRQGREAPASCEAASHGRRARNCARRGQARLVGARENPASRRVRPPAGRE